MNLPNKLTVLRVIMIPFFIFFLMYKEGENAGFRVAALTIFIIAALTDTLADKLLVCSALICLIQLKRIDAIIVTVIISREFIISGFRLVASDSGIVIAAGIWGKIKTVSQMLCICLLIMDIDTLSNFTNIMIYVMLALTIISLIDYIVKNYKVLSKGGM